MLIRERINGETRYRFTDPDGVTASGNPCHWINRYDLAEAPHGIFRRVKTIIGSFHNGEYRLFLLTKE